MLSLALLTAAVAGPGEAQAWLTWKKCDAELEIRAPAGEHLAPDAPVFGSLSVDGVAVELSTVGAALDGGWPLKLAAGEVKWGPHDISGSLRLSLCEDSGQTCRVADVAFADTVSGKKGSVALAPAAPAAAEGGAAHHSGDADAAFERAAASGKRVLIDFSAVWCPPCQVLAAEILHDPEEADYLAPFEVVELDADDPSSFALKSRYDVGGYPTVVVVEADGTLVDRLLGYPGEAATREWLTETAGEILSIEAVLADLDAVPTEQALEVAERLLAERKKDEARQLIERAPEGPDKELALFGLEPTLDELVRLVEVYPDRADDWIGGVYELLVDVEEGELEAERRQVAAALGRAMAGAEPVAASDYAYVAAAVLDGQEGVALYGAAAALLHSGMSGDPRLDRGHYTFLSFLYEEAGDREGALAVLEEAIAAFPEEFTYYNAAAGLMRDRGELERALTYAEAAAEFSYGDMALRAAMRRADILSKLERTDEAREVLQAAIDGAERPEEGQQVRTWRYIELAEEQLAGLDGVSGE
jgi:thiol-disulfide isomerase/thioredoxin